MYIPPTCSNNGFNVERCSSFGSAEDENRFLAGALLGETISPIEVYVRGAEENGEFGNLAGFGVYFGANDERNSYGPIDKRPTETRAVLTAILVAIEKVLESTTQKDEAGFEVKKDSLRFKALMTLRTVVPPAKPSIVIHTTSSHIEHLVSSVLSCENRRGWLTSKNRSHDDLDLLKAIQIQITEDVSVAIKLTPAENPNMKEAKMLANSGLQGSKSLWGKARKVHTAGVVCAADTGNILGGGYGVHWCGFMKGAVGCLNGTKTTERRAQLKAVHVALTQAVNMNLERVIVHVESEDVIRALTDHIYVWKSNNWTAEFGVPEPKDTGLLVEIDAMRDRIQFALKCVPKEDPTMRKVIKSVSAELADELQLCLNIDF